MKKRTGDLTKQWHPGPHAIVIPTNGDVDKQHNAVMGAGLAGYYAKVFPEAKRMLGKFLDVHGNHPYVLPIIQQRGEAIVTFPTKHTWKEKSNLGLIEQSAHKLVALTDVYGWEKVFMPRVGCGHGGLSWDQHVRPVLKGILDERFVVVWEPGHDPKPKKMPSKAKPKIKKGAV